MDIFKRFLKKNGDGNENGNNGFNGFTEVEIKYLSFFLEMCKQIKRCAQEIKEIEINPETDEKIEETRNVRSEKIAELQNLRRQFNKASFKIYTVFSIK